MDNETRGKSAIDPVDYKGDALVQVWIDSRVLATLSAWLDKVGNLTRFLSEVVKVPLSVLVQHLVEEGEIDMIDDTMEARTMLRRKYRVNLNPEDRGRKNLLHNIVLSDRRKRLSDIVSGALDGSAASDVSEPMRRTGRASVEELTERAMKVHHKLEEEDLAKAKQEVSDSIPALGFVKDDEVDGSKNEQS